MAVEKPGKVGEFFSPTLWPPWYSAISAGSLELLFVVSVRVVSIVMHVFRYSVSFLQGITIAQLRLGQLSTAFGLDIRADIKKPYDTL